MCIGSWCVAVCCFMLLCLVVKCATEDYATIDLHEACQGCPESAHKFAMDDENT